MNILYVGPLSIPIKNILSGKTEKEITGHPAYFYPYYKLVKMGHTVDFVFNSDFDKEYIINVGWIKKDNIIKNICKKTKHKSRVLKKINGLLTQLSLLLYTEIAVRKKKYDFIYCYESVGIAGNIVANIHGIPCGMRMFGDIMDSAGNTKYDYIKKHGAFKLFLLKPYIYISYKIKKSYILDTNDGTHGDITYELLKPSKPKYRFFFWKTGVNKDMPLSENISVNDKYVCFPARINPCKRQDRVIEILHLLHQNGNKLHLYFLGQYSTDDKYFLKLKTMMELYNLNDYVHFIGAVSQNQLKLYAQRAEANILFADVSNLGNVFYEIMSVGSVIISVDNNSLDDYLHNGENGFLVKDEEQAAKCVTDLLCSHELSQYIRENAYKTGQERFISLDARFDKEVELMLSAARKKDISSFPKII